MKCRHCDGAIIFVHADTFEMNCEDQHGAAEPKRNFTETAQLRQRLAASKASMRQMERNAQNLVVKAKTWTRVMATLSSPEERQRAVDELADAIDTFDANLGMVEPKER